MDLCEMWQFTDKFYGITHSICKKIQQKRIDLLMSFFTKSIQEYLCFVIIIKYKRKPLQLPFKIIINSDKDFYSLFAFLRFVFTLKLNFSLSSALVSTTIVSPSLIFAFRISSAKGSSTYF